MLSLYGGEICEPLLLPHSMKQGCRKIKYNAGKFQDLGAISINEEKVPPLTIWEKETLKVPNRHHPRKHEIFFLILRLKDKGEGYAFPAKP